MNASGASCGRLPTVGFPQTHRARPHMALHHLVLDQSARLATSPERSANDARSSTGEKEPGSPSGSVMRRPTNVGHPSRRGSVVCACTVTVEADSEGCKQRQFATHAAYTYVHQRSETTRSLAMIGSITVRTCLRRDGSDQHQSLAVLVAEGNFSEEQSTT